MKEYTVSELNQIVHDMHNKYGRYGKHRVLREICKYADVDMKTARQAFDNFGIFRQELERIVPPLKKTEEEKAAEEAKAAALREQKLIKQQTDYLNHLAKCPRCKSTSISCGEYPLNKGRAFLGGLLGGFEGSMIMGLTGKRKGYAVCMKCGKRWKV